MKNLKYFLPVLFATVLVTSCTKVIDLKLGNDTGKLVIEANITNINGPQSITLSQNVPFTSTNVYPPVSGATVTVSDDKGNTYPFTETQSGTYSIKHLQAIFGSTYTMKVTTGGKTYTAVSTMPQPVILDSISSKTDDFSKKSDVRNITVHLQDPAGVPNQYRFVLYDNGVQIKAVFAFDDEFTDGRYLNFDLLQNETDIHPGDMVTVEMQCIDRPVYTYWFTLSQQLRNGPGGGVTPSNPPTNITPATLGYFSAHTTQRITLLVK